MLAATVDQFDVPVVGLAADADAARARHAKEAAGVDLPTILVSRAALSGLGARLRGRWDAHVVRA